MRAFVWVVDAGLTHIQSCQADCHDQQTGREPCVSHHHLTSPRSTAKFGLLNERRTSIPPVGSRRICVGRTARAGSSPVAVCETNSETSKGLWTIRLTRPLGRNSAATTATFPSA